MIHTVNLMLPWLTSSTSRNLAIRLGLIHKRPERERELPISFLPWRRHLVLELCVFVQIDVGEYKPRSRLLPRQQTVVWLVRNNRIGEAMLYRATCRGTWTVGCVNGWLHQRLVSTPQVSSVWLGNKHSRTPQHVTNIRRLTSPSNSSFYLRYNNQSSKYSFSRNVFQRPLHYRYSVGSFLGIDSSCHPILTGCYQHLMMFLF